MRSHDDDISGNHISSFFMIRDKLFLDVGVFNSS